RRLCRPPALTYHRAHHVVLHPEAERRFAAAGGCRGLGGGTRWLSPAAGSPSAAADPTPPVRFLRRRSTGVAGPRRASPGSNARGRSVGCGFTPRHGSQESRASHVVSPPLCSTGRGVGEALLPPASSPASPRRAHWSLRLGGGACPAWPSALAVTWPPGPVRLLVSPSPRTSHLGAWDTDLNHASKFTFKPD
ncbi:RIKEN cDNA, partial [Microtus ochrogaster]